MFLSEGAIRKSLKKNGVMNVRSLEVGGQGSVYKAEYEGEEVAVKVFHLDHSKQRSEKEQKILRLLDHHAIPKFLKFISDGELSGIVMEYKEGCTLSEYIEEAGPLGPEGLESLFRSLVEVLEYLEAHQIVHRDIKPSNILFDSEKTFPLSLVDFGIAKKPLSQTKLTKTGTSIGTAAFMAPEQFSGTADNRSDIYGLGGVLFYAATGHPPWPSEVGHEARLETNPWQNPYGVTPRATNQIRDRRKKVPKHLAAIISKCLNGEPAKRYQHVREIKLNRTPSRLSMILVGLVVFALTGLVVGNQEGGIRWVSSILFKEVPDKGPTIAQPDSKPEISNSEVSRSSSETVPQLTTEIRVVRASTVEVFSTGPKGSKKINVFLENLGPGELSLKDGHFHEELGILKPGEMKRFFRSSIDAIASNSDRGTFSRVKVSY